MKQNREIWRDIPDYEGYYEASNLGRIRSLDRTVLTKNGQERFYKGKIMEGSFNKDGYKQVSLSRDNKAEHFLIHQIVAMSFLDHTPNGNTLVVDHINGIRTDNRVENLQIVSNRDNLSTCYRANESSLTSDFVGVSFSKTHKKWRTDIHSKGKNIYLGRFDNEIDAAKAYQKALAELENGTFKIENYRTSFTSKHNGVSYHKASQKYIANPSINGKQVYLGIYPTEEEAHQMILLFESAQPIVNNS